MTKTTIFLLILSVVIAGLLSFYQYFYKAKNRSKTTMFLAFLRFISIFTVLLLWINPVINRKITEIEKTPLPILVDNSSSITELEKVNNLPELYNVFLENKVLNEKYAVQLYSFDENLKTNKELDFKGNQTRLDNVAKELKQVYRNKRYPVILFTDGNQTQGNDYVYEFQENVVVNPIVLGDTTTIVDLKIEQINVNKYAFLKNKFPVEIFLQNNFSNNVETMFSISQGNQVLYKEKVNFSKNKKNIIINALLPAQKVGVQKFTATITPLLEEKNKTNNSKLFVVEVLDQRSEIAIITDINHPDIGALKRSIEVNEQRKVSIVKLNDPSLSEQAKQINNLTNFNLFIIYQPTTKFSNVFDHLKNSKSNSFIITGKYTDFNYLNSIQQDFQFKSTNQVENYSANFSNSFTSFAQENIGFENFSPLENKFVTIVSKGNVQTLLYARIRNVILEAPLLAFTDANQQRNAYLFGENIWKWRSENYLAKNDFQDFDLFIDKTIQYLVSNDSKKNLVVNYENFYNTGEDIAIKAQYFNKNYTLDNDAQLEITLVNTETKKDLKYNFTKTNTDFQVTFNNLVKGTYKFNVKETRNNITSSGSFEVLEYDSEKQFVNPNKEKLTQLAKNTNGNVYYPNQITDLVNKLIKDDNFKPIAKEVIEKSPLIDITWLLILLAITLATEWFIRKYTGLV
jgi:hypothetical protein